MDWINLLIVMIMDIQETLLHHLNTIQGRGQASLSALYVPENIYGKMDNMNI